MDKDLKLLHELVDLANKRGAFSLQEAGLAINTLNNITKKIEGEQLPEERVKKAQAETAEASS